MARVAAGEVLVIEAHKKQYGRVKVVDLQHVFLDFEAEIHRHCRRPCRL
jgi:hypothetical protein